MGVAAAPHAGALGPLLADKDVEVRRGAQEVLRRIGPLPHQSPGATPHVYALVRSLEDADGEIRQRGLESLVRLGPEVLSAHLDALAGRLEDPQWWVRRKAVEALSGFDIVSALQLPHVDALAKRLEYPADDDAGVRWLAVEALGRVAHICGPQHIATVAKALEDSDDWVRRKATEAMACFGPEAAGPHLDVLAWLLEDRNTGVRKEVLQALVRLGGATAGAVFGAVAARLFDQDREIRETAAKVLVIAASGMLESGDAAQLARHSGAVARLLVGDDEVLRLSLRELLAVMSTADAAPHVAAVVVNLEDDGEALIRVRALEALAGIPVEAGAPHVEILARCAEQDPDPTVRLAAWHALGRLGPARATAQIERFMGRWLRNDQPDRRAQGAEVLGGVGLELAAPHLSALASLLRDAEPSVRLAAAEALLRLGAAAMLPHIEAVVRLLGDADAGVRGAAVNALAHLGGATAARALDPGHLEALARRLEDPDPSVRASAVAAFGSLGTAASKQVGALAKRLRERDLETRKAVLRILIGLGDEGTAAIEAQVGEGSDTLIRWRIMNLFAELGMEAAPFTSMIMRLISDKDEGVKKMAAAALVAAMHGTPAKRGKEMPLAPVTPR